MSGSTTLSLEIDDNVTPGANAATAALSRMADAADTSTAAITRAGASADALTRRYVPAEAIANKLAIAQRNLAQVTATMDAAVADGSKTMDQRNAVVDGAAARVQALTAATNGMLPANAAAVDSHGQVTNAANRSSGAHAGITRELIIMGHEALMGNYTRLPGSMMVLAERSETAQSAISSLGGMLLTAGGAMAGLGVAAVAVGGYLVYQAYEADKAFQTLNKTLALSRADFADMALEATNAAKAVGAVGGGTKADTLAAAGVISAVPTFGGDQTELQSLLTLSGRLAVAMGTDMAAAAGVVAASLKDPAAEAKTLADQGFRYLDDATVSLITHLENSGETAKAQALLLDRLHLSVDSVADSYKSLADNIAAAHAADQAKWSSGGPSGAAALTPDATGRPVLLGPVQADGQRAVGLMQVNPQTAAGLGYSNISTQDNNIAAGMAYIQQLAASGRSNDQIAGAYNMGPTGYEKNPGAATNYIAKVSTANTSSLPADVASQIEYWGQVYGLTPDQIALGKRMAVVESGGRQYGAPITANDQILALNPQQGPNVSAADIRAGQVSQATLNDTLRATAGIKPAGGTQDAQAGRDLQDTLDRLTKAQALVSEGSPEWQKLQERVDATTAAYQKWQNPLGDTIDKLNAEASALLSGADASDKGRVAVLQAQAASQAAALAAGKYTDNIDALTTAILNKNAAQEADKGAKVVADLKDQAVAAAAAAQAAAQDPSAQYYAALDAQIQKATQSMRASRDATTDPAIRAALDSEVQQVDTLTRATAALVLQKQAAGQEYGQKQQLAYLQEETATLGENADIRARDLAVFKERQTIEQTMPGLMQDEKDKLVANAAAIADATTNLQRQQQTVNEIGNALTQVADQLGQAITTAFVSGQGAAVNWGNITRGVIASVLQEVLKLAVINPILNSALGTTRTTAGDVSSVGGVSSSGGSGGIGSLLSTGSSLYGLSGSGSGSSLLSSMGITGAGGILGASLWGTAGTATSESAAANVASLGADANLGGAAGTAGETGAVGSGATVGGFLGGAGAGFAAGSVLGGMEQSSLHKTGPGPMAGAAAGALAGAAIGSVVPVIGTLIGGVIGGVLGGAGGGLIGPHKASIYGGVALNVDSNGLLQTGLSVSQGMDNSANVAQANADVTAVNSFLSANGIKIANLGPGIVANAATPGNANPGGVQWIGAGNTPNDPNFYASLNSANATTGKTEFQNFQFSSTNAAVNKAISGQTFTNLAALETAVTNIQTFVNTTEPALIALGASPTVNGTLTTQITNLNTEFQAAITQATSLGLATTDLSAAWTAATKAANDAVAAQIAATDSGFTSRYMTAAASISGNPADAQAAQLYAFDTSAASQRTTLDGQLVAIYGDSYKSTAAYADQMAQLEKMLGEERLAIQQSYNDKLTATATTGVTSLASYVLKLQTGTNSPLSSAAQYSLAGQQFNADATAAQAGDWNSYTNLTGYADSLLSASRTQNGSGTAYAADFNRVLDVISSLATATPDTLTASIYAAQMQTQTQQLSAGLAAVTAAVNALRQAAGAPSRITA